MNEQVKTNSEWEVLTPNGWSDFSGIKKTTKVGGLFISFKCKEDQHETHLICSKNHRVKLSNGHFKTASTIALGDAISGNYEVTKVESLPETEHVFYDLLDVSKENEYYTNKITSHNCAHIEERVVTELWLSTAPALSTGGKAIIISTPKGTENLFYRIWSDAIEKKNTFHTIELPWTVHPDRDQTWFDRESASVRAAKGDWGVQQEFFCKFVASGETFIKTETLMELDKNTQGPKRRHTAHLEIMIWEEPQEGINYLLTADVASGAADDYSTACIVNLSTGLVAADFKFKLAPQDFAPILVQLGKEYNTACICPELNSYGLIVSEYLRKEKYPNVYYEKQVGLLDKEYVPEPNELPGWTTSVTTRPDMLAKLDYMLTTNKMTVLSSRFVDELKNFIWKNQKPQAKRGKNDDLVMAYAIAAILMFSIDAELVPAKSDEKPPIEVSTLLSMIGGLSSRHSVINLETKTVQVAATREEQSKQESPFKWIY